MKEKIVYAKVYKKLRAINYRGLATKAGIDRAQFNRLLSEEFLPSPKLIGRIAAALKNEAMGDALIKVYLQAVAEWTEKYRAGYVGPGE